MSVFVCIYWLLSFVSAQTTTTKNVTKYFSDLKGDQKKNNNGPTATGATDAGSTNVQPEPETANDFKELGNNFFRDGNYKEAVLNYTKAIKISPNDAVLYSNRSYAFLRLKQLYYANEDADKAVQLKPDWPKVGIIQFFIFERVSYELLIFTCIWRHIFDELKYYPLPDSTIYHYCCMDGHYNCSRMTLPFWMRPNWQLC